MLALYNTTYFPFIYIFLANTYSVESVPHVKTKLNIFAQKNTFDEEFQIA